MTEPTRSLSTRTQDLTGRTVGRITVLSYSGTLSNCGRRLWHCQCTCGALLLVSAPELTKPRKYEFSCGCALDARTTDLAGRVFSNLTVLKYTRRRTSGGSVIWECRCICGALVYVGSNFLLMGKRKSCGCLRRGPRSALYRGVGDLSGQKWTRMQKSAKRRGYVFEITIQYAWSLFEAQQKRCVLTGTLLKMSPNDHSTGATTASLDRIDNTKGYIEGNVQWVHLTVNLMKQTLTSADFIFWCGEVAHHVEVSKTPLASKP